MKIRLFTEAESERLRELWETDEPLGTIAGMMQRSPTTIFRHAIKLGLPKRDRQRKPWTDADGDQLRQLWVGDMHINDIGELMDRSTSILYRQAKALGLTNGRRFSRAPRLYDVMAPSPPCPVTAAAPSKPQPLDAHAYRKQLQRTACVTLIAHGVEEAAAELATHLIARGLIPRMRLET